MKQRRPIKGSWLDIIEDFRLMSFYVAYQRLYGTVADNNSRFALSLAYSSQSIPPDAMPKILEWYAQKTRRTTKRSIHARSPVPEAVR